MAGCNRKQFAKKLVEVRRLRSKLPADLKPLFNHILQLAVSNLKKDASALACRRAGREIRMAKNLVSKHGR